ncbi:ATP-binding protein [Candidatus Eisenbacteria bacterium]|uniref:ATP-binding protein n=1 Tax=Eiseniibacteriota bacterium TaxID=2212470 RepID=A0ABV6YJM7_UNCEI
MASSFVGRRPQLQLLQAIRYDTPEAHLTAIYGRRRIGKTRLVKEAYKNADLLHFEGLEGVGSREQKRHFLKTLSRHSGKQAHQLASMADWEDLLVLLAEYVAERPCVIFFDEFQWMAAERSDLIGKLKYVWDNYFKEAGHVHLILCGSVSSFLVKKVIRSRALYGRIDNIIHLGPLEFADARTGFFANRSVLEALEYYLVFGGVPKYLEMYAANRSVRLNISNLCFKPGAYFLEEFERLFASHFGKVHHYRSVVEFLAGRAFASREEIAKHTGLHSGGRISGFLENLVLAGFIESYGSIHSPRATRLKRYRIADPYLRFYFRFICPLVGRIARAQEGVPLPQALPEKRYGIFLGLAFESFCSQHAHSIAKTLGFSAVAYECGSWFKRRGVSAGAQIDLLYKRADNVITLCEIKHRSKVTKEVIAEVEAKVEAMGVRNSVTIEKVLISALPPGKELYDAAYFVRILTAEDFATQRTVDPH